ncbi:DUF397 domain-containing protein [Streptomyces sp. NPDC002454]
MAVSAPEPTTWRRSSHSGHNAGDCVEWSPNHRGEVAVRDSKRARAGSDGPVVRASRTAWTHLVHWTTNGSSTH